MFGALRMGTGRAFHEAGPAIEYANITKSLELSFYASYKHFYSHIYFKIRKNCWI